MVANGCSVLNCPTRKNAEDGGKVSKHSFPTQRDLCLKWRNLCGNPAIASHSPASLTKNYVVCSLHFKEEEKKKMGKRSFLIHKSILPSLKLPPPLSEILPKKNEPPTLDFNSILSKINFANIVSNIDYTGINYLPVQLPEEEFDIFDEDDEDDIDFEPESYSACDTIETCEPLQEICRTCLETCDDTSKVEIFSERGKELRLEEKIHKHLPIRVQEDDILPLQMCAKCVQQLDAFHSMVLACSNADTKLRDMFNYPDVPLLNTNDAACEFPDNIDDVDDNSYQGDGDFQDLISCHDDITNVSDTDFAMSTKNDEVKENNKENAKEESNLDEENGKCEINLNEEKNKRGYRKVTLYKCQVCSEIVEKKINLDKHLAQAHNKYQCDHCFMLYDSTADLQIHSYHVHSKTCEICKQTYTSKKRYDRHMITFHANVNPAPCKSNEKEENPLEEMLIFKTKQIHNHEEVLQMYECNDCCEKYLSLTDFESHRKIHAPEISRKYECTDCSEKFDLFCDMKSHRKIHEPSIEEPVFLCELCGINYSTLRKLQFHMAMHANAKAYECDTCFEKFNTALSLRLHKKRHVEKAFKCNLCPAKFRIFKNFNIHIKKHHLSGWYYQCIVCSIKFKSEEKVIKHYEIHSEEICNKEDPFKEIFRKISDFQCSVCDKYYFTKTALLTHNKNVKCRRLEKGETPNYAPIEYSDFLCETCGKYLSNANSLRAHKLCHSDTKLYNCEYCNIGYNARSKLVDHIRTHTGEKPYECEFCNKRFHKKNSLTTHRRRVHLNIRPYKCDMCGKTFPSNPKLKIHYRTHTGERPYKCEVCSRTFIQSTDILRHRRLTFH